VDHKPLLHSLEKPLPIQEGGKIIILQLLH